MIKAYMCVNQFNELKHIYTKPELHLRLRDNAKACRTHQQLDEKVVELHIDVPKDQVKDHPKDKGFEDLDPGLYRHGSGGWLTFRGDPVLVKEIRTVTTSNLDDPKIPRMTIIAVVDDEAILKSEYWWNDQKIQDLVLRFKPKWICKGYLHSIVGKDKVRIDYIPVAVNESALTNIVKDLVEGLSQMVDQFDTVFDDHGSNQEIELLDL